MKPKEIIEGLRNLALSSEAWRGCLNLPVTRASNPYHDTHGNSAFPGDILELVAYVEGLEAKVDAFSKMDEGQFLRMKLSEKGINVQAPSDFMGTGIPAHILCGSRAR